VLILIKMKTAMLAGALAAPILATVFAPTPPHDQDGAMRLHVHLLQLPGRRRFLAERPAGRRTAARTPPSR
jgi:hypothetical protein